MLSLVAVPALWIIVASTWAVGWAPRVIVEDPAKLLWMPLGALGIATIGMVVGAPLLSLPEASQDHRPLGGRGEAYPRVWVPETLAG